MKKDQQNEVEAAGTDETIEFAIENMAQEFGVPGNVVFDAPTEQSDILHAYLLPCYGALRTQGRECIVQDLIGVMGGEGRRAMRLYHGSSVEVARPDLSFSHPDHQMCFRTQEAVERCLAFLGSEEL